MATKTGQRVGIWIIAIAMVVGTVGTFGALILENENASNQASSQQEALDDLYAQIREDAKKNQTFDGYDTAAFDASSVTELEKKDLRVGSGEKVEVGDKVTVSYFGWTPKGEIFDSTKKEGADNKPIEFELAEGSLIEGWVKGVPGMKVGGARELSIPASQAYGSSGSAPLIGPNTPLKFVIRVEAIAS